MHEVPTILCARYIASLFLFHCVVSECYREILLASVASDFPFEKHQTVTVWHKYTVTATSTSHSDVLMAGLVDRTAVISHN